MKTRLEREERAVGLLFAGTLISFGGYYELVSALVSIGLLLCLWRMQKKAGQLELPWNFRFAVLCLIPLAALFSLFYAVDWGEAFLGWIKFVPLPLFALAAAQLAKEKRLFLLSCIPGLAAVMTVISVLGWFTPAKTFFFQAGRLCGFWTYANTWALLLLIAVVVLCEKGKMDKKDSILFLICLGGIILTGSRGTFLISAFYLIFAFLTKAAMRKRLAALCFAVMSAAALFLLVSGNVQSFGRIFTLVSHNSTFWGRLLYSYDALHMIKDFPLGMGYRGYYFVQGTYQTGDYAVMHVHNEFLQCALDFGLFCAVLAAAAAILALSSKQISPMQRKILLVCLIHSLFDFDFQFLAVGMICILCMELETKKVLNRQKTVCLLSAGLMAVQLYGASFLGLQAVGAKAAAEWIYPGQTLAQTEQMQLSHDTGEKELLAERIGKRNKYCAAVYKVKAELAAAKKDFINMKQYGREAIKRDRYNELVYEDYLKNLSLALDYYVRIGDQKMVRQFLNHTAKTKDLIGQAEAAASPLAFKTRDNPAIVLSEQYDRYLEKMNDVWEEAKDGDR